MVYNGKSTALFKFSRTFSTLLFWRLVFIVTLEDVALEAGCSVNTASRAINNKPDVNKVTRAKVLEAAKRLGYVPNTLAKSLVTKTTGSIGIVVPNITNPIYARLIQSIENCTSNHNYSFFLSQSLNDPNKEAEVIGLLCQKRIDGLLVVPFEERIENFDYLVKFNIPTVFMLNDIPLLNFSFVGPDNEKCLHESISYLIKSGCRSTLFIDNFAKPQSIREKNISILKSILEKSSLQFNPELVLNVDLTVKNGYTVCKKVIDSGLSFDSIFVFNDAVVPGIYKALEEASLRCPEDIKIIGYGNIDECPFYNIPLSSNEVSIEDVGQKSFELLMSAITDESTDTDNVSKIIEPTSLVIRESC